MLLNQVQILTLNLIHCNLQIGMSKSVKSQEKELKVSTFLKICILLCIGNLITVTRIHMFDQILVVAEDYFNKSIQDDENSHHYFVPKITNFEDITTLATDLRLEQGYLLPFTMEIGALIIVTVPCFKRQGFLSLLFLLIANLVSFTALLINPHNFLIYRITYAIQSAIVYPMITLSSLSVMKAIPLELVPIKGYYSCLMFILPQLGRAIASYFFNVSIQTMENSTQILHTSLTRLLMVGTFFTFMAFFVIFQSKKNIKQTLDQRLNDAIEIAKIQHFSDEQTFEPNKQILKQKLKVEYEALMFGKKQGIKIFEKQQLIKGGDKQKRQQKAISILRQNTGTLIMVWGVAFAIGNQVMDLKKQFLTILTLTLTITDKRQEMEAELRQSNIISEIIIFSCSIVISFIMIKLIRAGKVQSLRLVSICYIVGYFFLLLLFMMANNMITMHLWSLHLAVLATRVSFFVFIVPTLFDLQQAGISAFEGVNILLLINWALEIILRVGLMVFGIQAKVFALACIVVVCCFYLDRIDKQIKNTIEQPVEYNKIQEGETYDETEITEDEDTIEPSTDTDNKGVVVKN